MNKKFKSGLDYDMEKRNMDVCFTDENKLKDLLKAKELKLEEEYDKWTFELEKKRNTGK